MLKTNYNSIANSYNKRYTANYLVNIEEEIKSLIEQNNYKTVLEAGCGTGRWINSLTQKGQSIFGLDYSFEMLRLAKVNNAGLDIVNANAVHIPFKESIFDMIFCVNAIHHFPDKRKFIQQCKEVLTNQGMLAVFGVDPHIDKQWYVYEYFENVYENDLKRFPSLESLNQIFNEEGFNEFEIKTVEISDNNWIGNEVFNDPFLQKNHCSQLANLSNEEYGKGINKIKLQLSKNPETVFESHIVFYLTKAINK